MYPYQHAAVQPTLHAVTMAMYAALAAQDVQCANLFLQLYAEPTDQSEAAQIQNANRFWRLQLGSMQVNTIAVRQNLLDNIQLMDWMRLFASQVAPVIVAFQLPRPDCTAHMRLVD